jgi:hypothetical protein
VSSCPSLCSRLSLRLCLCTVGRRITIWLLLLRHPVRPLGQMPSNRPDCPLMSSSMFRRRTHTDDRRDAADAVVDASPFRRLLCGCSHRVLTDVRARAFAPYVPSAGMPSRSHRRSGMRSGVACSRESLGIANLRGMTTPRIAEVREAHGGRRIHHRLYLRGDEQVMDPAR